ncbi:unnamed protein product, partial [Amoebophrya sp. A25]
LPIEDLPDWAQPAFAGATHLNTIQSKVYKAAFRGNANLLMCAPTGAGKTNVALLTVLKLIHQKLADNDGKLELFPDLAGDDDDAAPGVFKMVYLAPMKALCAEVVENFNLGIQVREMTGDISLSKQELDRTHVIVTVPEKWDVMTRNTTSGGGSGDEHSIQRLTELVIIDEIHLLHENRGAVIESVVARTLRYQEATGHTCRLVGLSATLPNFGTVGDFLHCPPENIFYFDGSYRPIPLEQTFIGIRKKAYSKSKAAEQMKIKQQMDELCFEEILSAVAQDHQCMIFVHSRKDTYTTAIKMSELASQRNKSLAFQNAKESTCKDQKTFGRWVKEAEKAKSKEVRELFWKGFGVHHAGMLRGDRSTTEQMFFDGAIKVLVCTATLAWGVNLPARKVVIKGTQIYMPDKGGFNDIGILDVMQIFGRAGRPGLDTMGQATLITEKTEAMDSYLRRLNHQVAIDSKFLGTFANALNAEVAMGNLHSLQDGAEFLTYTYLYQRAKQSPVEFGLSQEQLLTDPQLKRARRTWCKLADSNKEAAQKLNDARLIRVDASDNYYSTDLGRVAAKYYLDYETAENFSKNMTTHFKDEQILLLFGEATEFKQLRVRDDEVSELDALREVCKVKITGPIDTPAMKVAVLLQAWLSRKMIQSFSLSSDVNFITQSAGRLFRAMFEITLTRVTGLSNMSESLLEWTKRMEYRMWPDQHMLRHFCYAPTWNRKDKQGLVGGNDSEGFVSKSEEDTCDRLEQKRHIADWEALWDMEWDELSYLIPNRQEATAVWKYTYRVPYLSVQHTVTPVTGSIMRIRLNIKLHEHCEWSDNWSGSFEPWFIWVEDPRAKDILHSEEWKLRKTEKDEEAVVSFVIPLQQPHPPQYVITIISSRWVGLKTVMEFSVSHLLLPAGGENMHTPLLELFPLPKTALQNRNYENLYNFSHFNPVQTQVFHTLYHTNHNVLVGAPTGSGKTNMAELAILRLPHAPEQKVIYIAPLKALAKERMTDWSTRFGKKLGKSIVELTGDFTPDVTALDAAQLIITTPEKWDGISRHWQSRAYVQRVGLVVIDEIHLLGQDRGPVLEVIVSRMRYISANLDVPIRFVGLSTALANSHDIADWLGIGMVGCFNFKPSVRPVPMTVHIRGFPEKHYCPRMATMNRPCYDAIKNHSPTKPTLIFVSSRRQTRLTALDIIGLMNADEQAEAARAEMEADAASMALAAGAGGMSYAKVAGMNTGTMIFINI